MQINWGAKIFIVYTVFVVFMLGMVYLCTRQHFDLVSTDYYAQELKYQQVIDGTSNARALGIPITVTQTISNIEVVLPASQSAIENGKIFFYRPSDASKDVTVAFANQKFSINKSILIPGWYKVKITWANAGKNYFEEQRLIVSSTSIK